MTPLFNGTSCLSASVINGHLEIVIRLLQIGGRALALLQYEGGSTCLHLAAFSGRTLIVQVLLAIGGRELLSSRFNGGSTALHITAQEGHVDVVQQLFEVGGSELLMYRDRCHSGFVKVPFSGSKESRGVVAGAGGLASRRRCCTGRGGETSHDARRAVDRSDRGKECLHHLVRACGDRGARFLQPTGTFV